MLPVERVVLETCAERCGQKHNGSERKEESGEQCSSLLAAHCLLLTTTDVLARWEAPGAMDQKVRSNEASSKSGLSRLFYAERPTYP